MSKQERELLRPAIEGRNHQGLMEPLWKPDSRDVGKTAADIEEHARSKQEIVDGHTSYYVYKPRPVATAQPGGLVAEVSRPDPLRSLTALITEYAYIQTCNTYIYLGLVWPMASRPRTARTTQQRAQGGLCIRIFTSKKEGAHHQTTLS